MNNKIEHTHILFKHHLSGVKSLSCLILFGLCFASCKSSKSTSLINKSNGNNEVVTEGNYLNSSEDNHDKVIFDGENNKVIFEYLNVFFNDKNSADVIIVEGSGNEFRLTHHSGIDNSKNSTDTIILKGNNNHVELLQSYFLSNDENSSDNILLELENDFQIFSTSNRASVVDTSEIENKITNEWVPIRDALDHYLKESIKGNWKAAFYLGEMYQLGVGVGINIPMAEYYYLIAANNGHMEAQSSLGYIYESNWDGLSKDIDKSVSWYKKAALQGDGFAKERLEELEF